MSKVVSKMIVNISSDIEGIDIMDYRQKNSFTNTFL